MGATRIRSFAALAALLLACGAVGAQAQEAAQETTGAGSIDNFDLANPGVSPEQLLVTNAAANRPDKPCEPSNDPMRIVVCAPDPDKYRIDSTLDEATRAGRAVRDGLPRAPEFAPSCRDTGGVCMRVGKEPYRPIFIDLEAIPEPLPREVAEKVLFALTPEELAEARRQAALADPFATPRE